MTDTYNNDDQPGKPGLRHILAIRVRTLRNARRWSQADLADASGLHRTYISLIEREECGVGLDKLERLAKALGVPASDLLSSPPEVPRRIFVAEEARPVYGEAGRTLSECTTDPLLSTMH